MKMSIHFCQVGYLPGTHKTEILETDVNTYAEFLDDAPAWCDRVVFMIKAPYQDDCGRSVYTFAAQFDFDKDEREWFRHKTNSNHKDKPSLEVAP